MEPTNRTTTTARPRPGSLPGQGGSGAGQSTGRSGSFEEDVERRRFVTVLRGYDRIEVDEYIDDLLAVVATLRTSAADADSSRRTAEERAAAAERRAGESAKAQPAAAPPRGAPHGGLRGARRAAPAPPGERGRRDPRARGRREQLDRRARPCRRRA